MASGKGAGAFKRSQGYGGPRTDARIKGTKVVIGGASLKKTPSSDVKSNILYNEIFQCLMINKKVDEKAKNFQCDGIFEKYYECIYPLELNNKKEGRVVNTRKKVFKPKTLMSDYLKNDEGSRKRTQEEVGLAELSISKVFEKLKTEEKKYDSDDEKKSDASIKQLEVDNEDEEEDNDYNQDYYADDVDDLENGSEENSAYD